MVMQPFNVTVTATVTVTVTVTVAVTVTLDYVPNVPKTVALTRFPRRKDRGRVT